MTAATLPAVRPANGARRSPKKVRYLFVIDPQVDFCDPTGALFVGGADDDMKVRLPKLVRGMLKGLDDIFVTMDSHHPVHIAHPIFWLDRDGNHPGPITVITADQVRKGDYRARRAKDQDRALAYVESLEKNGRYVLCIWPPHCLIGTPGNNIVPELRAAIREWEDQYAIVNFVTKGSNPYTEHYSVLLADVPDPKDPGTQLNGDLIAALQAADEVLIAGEALSHCVCNTVTDLVNNFGSAPIDKLILLTDCSSSVGGGPGVGLPTFDQMGQQFIRDMVARGMRTATISDFLS